MLGGHGVNNLHCPVTLTKAGGVGGGHGVNNLHCPVTLTKAGTVGVGSWGQQPSLSCDTDQGRDCWRGGGGVMGSTTFTVL